MTTQNNSDSNINVNSWIEEARATPLIDFVPRRYHIALRRSGHTAHGPCPICKAGTDRFGIDIPRNIWTCRKCVPQAGQKQAGDDIISLVMLAENIDFESACEIITGQPKPTNGKVRQLWTNEGRFYYQDANGVNVARVDRLRDHKGKKTFVQSTPDSSTGEWIKVGLPKGQRIPYRLPELIANNNRPNPLVVLIAEGEKCVDALAELGFVATCNIGGTGMGWQPEMTPYLVGREVIILCDNDNPGRKHGASVYEALTGTVKSARVLHIEDVCPCGDGFDIYDFIVEKKQTLGNDVQALKACVVELLTKPVPVAVAPPLPDLVEQSAAETFITEQAGNLRYMPEQKEWLFAGSDGLWRFDHSLETTRRVNAMCLALARSATRAKDQVALGKASFAAAVERLSKSHPDCATPIAQWDANPWLFAGGSKLVDLRSGEVRDIHRDDLIMRRGPVAPDWQMDTPVFDRFMGEIVCGDAAYASYLLRFCGYCLSGDTSEQVILFLWGTGRNGKGTFVRLLSYLLGDYQTATEIGMWLTNSDRRHLNEIARLAGKRLITSAEPQAGHRWDEARLKKISGGDTMTANFMHRDQFDFIPMGKLLFNGNRLPSFPGMDGGIRRRIQLCPFAATIMEDAVIKDLDARLQAEAPGILAKMIDGCLDWQERGGLCPPDVVTAESEQYFEIEDTIATFLEDHVEHERGRDDWFVATEDMQKRYRLWAERNGEHPLTGKTLAKELGAKGIVVGRNKRNTKRGYRYCKLKQLEQTSLWED